MLVFDPNDPFPLIENLGVDYEAEKAHALAVDQWLGFRAEQVEQEIIELEIRKREFLSHGNSAAQARGEDRVREFWVGKSVQTFSTPYTELRMMLEEIKPQAQDVVVDLGSGYARMAHVLDRHFPGAVFRGFEMISKRHEEAARVIHLHDLKNARVECTDVTTLDLASLDSNLFFLYDFGSREDVENIVEKFKTLAREVKLTVIARGGRSRDIIEKQHPWLSQVVRPQHRGHYSIFRSAE